MKILLYNICKRLVKRSKPITQQPYTCEIGKYLIKFPPGHPYKMYRGSHGNYDQPVATLAEIMQRNNISGWIIDIGANVGDSTAAIASACRNSILCIEGDHFFLKYLRENVQNLRPGITVDGHFVQWSEENTVALVRDPGTASLQTDAEAMNANQSVESVSRDRLKHLDYILDTNSVSMNDICLIKVDTDGHDFEILLDNRELLKSSRPIILFEYDIFQFEYCEMLSYELLEYLTNIGYHKFVVFDNFGLIIQVISSDHKNNFRILNNYLRLNRRYGVKIYYYDVACFCKEHAEVAKELVTVESEMKAKTGGQSC